MDLKMLKRVGIVLVRIRDAREVIKGSKSGAEIEV